MSRPPGFSERYWDICKLETDKTCLFAKGDKVVVGGHICEIIEDPFYGYRKMGGGKCTFFMWVRSLSSMSENKDHLVCESEVRKWVTRDEPN